MPNICQVERPQTKATFSFVYFEEFPTRAKLHRGLFLFCGKYDSGKSNWKS